MKSYEFTLTGETTLRPIRKALYWALGPCLDEMDAALMQSDREECCGTRSAYRRLTAVGELLDKMGWTKRTEKTLTISAPDAATLLMRVLGEKLEDEEERAAGARRLGETRLASACETHSGALREILSTVAVTAMAVGLLGEDAGDA